MMETMNRVIAGLLLMLFKQQTEEERYQKKLNIRPALSAEKNIKNYREMVQKLVVILVAENGTT